jgi:hypothetical protein
MIPSIPLLRSDPVTPDTQTSGAEKYDLQTSRMVSAYTRWHSADDGGAFTAHDIDLISTSDSVQTAATIRSAEGLMRHRGQARTPHARERVVNGR